MRRRSIAITTLLVLALARVAVAQESGGSFGGSSWDDEPSGGSSSDWGSSGSSDWGSSGSSGGGIDYAEQARQDREAAEREAAAEQAREEAERRRQEEEAERARVERQRRLDLPPLARIRDLDWPSTPPRPAVASRRVTPVASPALRPPRIRGSWTTYESPIMAPASLVVQGPPSWLGAGILSTPVGLGLLLLAYLFTRERRPRASTRAAPAYRPSRAPQTAARVSIAFDWTARAELQAQLAAMAKRFDMRSRAGLASGATAIAELLADHLAAARYASWELSTGDARQWFTLRTQDLRARFRSELVRNDAVTQSPEYRAKESEGEGLVVVSVLVAGKAGKQAPPARLDALALAAAIAGLRPGGDTVLALEVVWSPAAENDRMSSYELEKLYPELTRIREGVGARGCPYCKAAYPAELRRCPTCGAPS